MAGRLLSITLEVPYRGITDAGGEFVRRHYHVLSEMAEVSVLARDTTQNRQAVTKVDPANLDVSFAQSDWRSLPVLRPFRALRNLVMGFALGSEFSAPLKRRLRNLQLSDVEVVEFQWTEAAQWAKDVRRAAPQAALLLVAHDIVSQRRLRAHERARGMLPRLYTALRLRATERTEARILRAVDCVVVFSEKDAELAHRMSPTARVKVVPPWLTDDGAAEDGRLSKVKRADPDHPVVLFTGAMGRPENDDAATWLVSTIWPTVLASVPGAKLVIAGSRPSERLLEAAANEPSIDVTGFVEDLDGMYRTADVFVSPLRLGAGVKFKTISAMIAGLPVVSTSVGAEGVGKDEDYVRIADDPESLAAGIVEACSDLPTWHARARQVSERMRTLNGREAYVAAIRDAIQIAASARSTRDQLAQP